MEDSALKLGVPVTRKPPAMQTTTRPITHCHSQQRWLQTLGTDRSDPGISHPEDHTHRNTRSSGESLTPPAPVSRCPTAMDLWGTGPHPTISLSSLGGNKRESQGKGRVVCGLMS